MTVAGINYSGWALVFLAFVTLLIAPATVSTLILRRFYGFKADCIPIKPNSSGGAKLWEVNLENKSRVFGGFIIYIYPSRPGNAVDSFKFKSANDGGLVASPSISDGALMVRLKRFARKRSLALQVRFTSPDLPNIESNRFRVRKTIRWAKTVSEDFVLGAMYHRMMLIMLLFVGVTLIIIIRIVFAVSFNN